MDKQTLIKAQYLKTALKPEDFSNYKMYIGDKTINFKYKGIEDVELKELLRIMNISEDII